MAFEHIVASPWGIRAGSQPRASRFQTMRHECLFVITCLVSHNTDKDVLLPTLLKWLTHVVHRILHGWHFPVWAPVATQPERKAGVHRERAVPAALSLASGCLELLQPSLQENVQLPSLLGTQDLSVQKATVLSDRAKPASGTMLTATKSHPYPALSYLHFPMCPVHAVKPTRVYSGQCVFPGCLPHSTEKTQPYSPKDGLDDLLPGSQVSSECPAEPV